MSACCDVLPEVTKDGQAGFMRNGGSNSKAIMSKRSTGVTLLRSGAIALLMAMPGGCFNPAHAQTASTATQTLSFSVPSQGLGSALAAFADRAGLHLLFTSELVAGKQSGGLSGSFTRTQALSRLLAGTGLTYQFTSAGTVTILGSNAGGGSGPANVPGAVTLDTINVQGAGNPLSTMTPMPAYAGGQVATGGTVGMLGNRSVMDTPFNQTSYTSKLIQDQQAQTILDVLDNDASTQAALTPGFHNNQYYIRGFLASVNDIGLNGLYGLLPTYTVPVDYAERVDVLKGPSNLLNGMPPGGSVGGTINIITKRATDEPLTQFTTGYISRGQAVEHVDIGRRFGQDNAFGIRFNGTYRNGDEPYERGHDEFGTVALGLDYTTPQLRLSGDFSAQMDNALGPDRAIGIYTTPSFVGLPAAPDPIKNFQTPWGFQITRDALGMVKGEFDVTDKLTVYAAIGVHQDWFHYYNYIYDTPTDLLGDFTTHAVNDINTYRILSGQTGLRWSVKTGPVNHLINVSGSDIYSIYGTGYTQSANYAGNIYSSPYGPPLATAGGNPAARTSSVTVLPTVGIADTMSILNDRIQFTAGVRRQEVNVDNYNAGLPTANGLLASTYREGAWSPAFTLLVKPLQNVSLYANYIQGLQQGTLVGSTYANAGTVLPPYVSKQIETGVKVDWGRITSTLSFFEITQPSTVPVTTAGNALPTLALNGEQRNRGIELESYGELMPSVRLLGGITYIDARQVASANNATNGLLAPGVPAFQLKAGAEWDTPFLRGLTLTSRIIYTGEEYVDNANRLQVPDWTRIDLGARYTFISPWNNKPVTLRVDVQNIANRAYWIGEANSLTLGAPRTILANMTMNF